MATCLQPAQLLQPITEIIVRDGLPPIEGRHTVQLRLMYRGLLPVNGNVKEKFVIRRQLNTQLERLWQEQALLRELTCRVGAVAIAEQSKSEGILHEDSDANFAAGIEALGLNHERNGHKFIPLAQERFFLRCSIDILFLRREGPGRVVMNGDIDNRLKTLFDALQMPQVKQEIGSELDGNGDSPFFVLLENDNIIADVSVVTDRLLDVPLDFQHESNYVSLVLDVKLQPTRLVDWHWVFA